MTLRSNIAVIIPVYNRRSSIISALSSVAQQTVPPTHLVVVDDGSDDDTPQQVNHFFARDWPFRCTLIQQSNGGPGAARNRGVTEATECPILSMLDSDDIWPNNYLERVQETFLRHPDAIVTQTDIVRLTKGSTKPPLHCPASHFERDTTARLCRLEGGRLINPSGTCIRRSAFAQAGGFDEELRYAEDWNLWMKLSLIGRFVAIAGNPVQMNDGELGSGEAGHAATQVANHHWYEAQALDRFLHINGGIHHLDESVWHPRLVKLWYKAGRGLQKIGQISDARMCFKEALKYQAYHPKMWLRYLQTCRLAT